MSTSSPLPALVRYAYGSIPFAAIPVEESVDVAKIAASVPPSLPVEVSEIVGLYRVPKVTDDGSCSVPGIYEDAPVDLFPLLYGFSREDPSFLSRAAVRRVHALQLIVNALAITIGAEWVGVYRIVDFSGGAAGSSAATSAGGASVSSGEGSTGSSTNSSAAPSGGGGGGAPTSGRALVKEAYVGSPSRAFFPLTAAFAELSNNSTIAMTREVVIINSVKAMSSDEPYYVCDAKVQAEICAPICDPVTGDCIGIIDAEAWRPAHFTKERISVVLDCCRQLGALNLLQNLT